MYGLNKSQWKYLQKEVIEPLKISGATTYIFGSRARGDHQSHSDVDILVRSDKELMRLIGLISEKLEEGPFPYKIDIVEEKNLADSYRESVFRDRIKIS